MFWKWVSSMRKFALIGHPLGHSLSPQIHERLFKLDGFSDSYELLDIPPKKLAESFELLRKFEGLNITIPHKIEIIPMCDELDKTAKRYGAINCIKNQGGKIIGYNTDVLGFVKSIEQLGTTLKSDVLLLGCGGAGRMIALETLYQEGNLTIAVRKDDLKVAYDLVEYARDVVPTAKAKVVLIDEIKGKFNLLVNSTPVGMYPKSDNMPVSIDVIKNVNFVFDLVYNPTPTKLVKTALANGARAKGGMAMLVLQAVAAHEIWDNSTYNNTDINSLISEMEQSV